MSGDLLHRACRRRGWLLVVLLALCAVPVQAQNYPSRPIKLVVPFPAGGPPTSSVASWPSTQGVGSASR